MGSDVRSVATMVVGGGMAGLPMALRASRHGPAVLVEPGPLGGTCLNRGCIPTKTMIHSAKVAHLARRGAEFGVDIGEVRVDLAAVVDRKNEVLTSIRDGSYRAVDRADNLTFLHDRARFVDQGLVQVNGVVYRAERVVINTGARPTVPDVPGLSESGFLTSTEVLDLVEIPEHLVVVGGGYVGCELAQMFRRFGSGVTLVQRADRLLPDEDPAVSEVVETAFAGEGIEVLTGAAMLAVDRGKDGSVEVMTGSGTVTGSHLLLAVGRTPNTDDLGLDDAEVSVDNSGFVVVDDRYATSAEGVYAIGDVIGPPMFTHSARDDAALLYRSVFKDDTAATSRLVPHAVFTDPEVASFGLTEPEARDRLGEGVSVGSERFRGVGKARAIGETAGFVKIVTGPDRKILGASIVGPDAGNLVHELVVAASAGMTVDELAGVMHIHPTLAEAVSAAAGGVHRPSMED